MIVHLCFDAAAAFLYTASIAIALAAAAFVFTQMLAVGLAIAAVSFLAIATLWGRKLWRKHQPSSGRKTSPLFAH
jgi:drug/metabolite transporter (DMT)-like permease